MPTPLKTLAGRRGRDPQNVADHLPGNTLFAQEENGLMKTVAPVVDALTDGLKLFQGLTDVVWLRCNQLTYLTNWNTRHAVPSW